MTTTLNVGINGLGRIGRCLLRLVANPPRTHPPAWQQINITAVNAPAPVHTTAHLLKYDSTHGVLDADIQTNGDNQLIINGAPITYLQVKDAANLDWDTQQVDYVLECSGLYNNRPAAAAHLQAGAKKVLVSAPCQDADLTVVYGVNHHALTAAMQVVSNASCTTNCLAPVIDVLQQQFGILSGSMTTIHAYTRDQRLVDATHKDLRRARSANESIIPTKTGAATAIGLVIPALAGKLNGMAVRVPTKNVSLVDLTCVLAQPTTADAVNNAMQVAANGRLAGVLAVNQLPLVSTDFNGRCESSIFDADQTLLSDGNLLKVLSWYDNEIGFSARMFDTLIAMATC